MAVECGSQEIGTGARTIFAQVAAERLGMPAERVAVALGSTSLPETGGTFGSSSTISVGSAVAAASDALLQRIAALAGSDTAPPPDDWPALMSSKGVNRLEAEGRFALPGEARFDAHGGASGYSMHTFGALFVEMEVDEALGVARMRRCVGCYSAGRILNPVTARSQMIGGIIWGYGRAMLEVSAMDPRFGRYLSKNLSGVLLPVNADIPQAIDVRSSKRTTARPPPSACAGSASWARSASPPPSPTPFTTRPASACASCPSRSAISWHDGASLVPQGASHTPPAPVTTVTAQASPGHSGPLYRLLRRAT